MEYEAYDTPTRQSKSVRGRPSVDAFYAQEPPALRTDGTLFSPVKVLKPVHRRQEYALVQPNGR